MNKHNFVVCDNIPRTRYSEYERVRVRNEYEYEYDCEKKERCQKRRSFRPLSDPTHLTPLKSKVKATIYCTFGLTKPLRQGWRRSFSPRRNEHRKLSEDFISEQIPWKIIYLGAHHAKLAKITVHQLPSRVPDAKLRRYTTLQGNLAGTLPNKRKMHVRRNFHRDSQSYPQITVREYFAGTARKVTKLSADHRTQSYPQGTRAKLRTFTVHEYFCRDHSQSYKVTSGYTVRKVIRREHAQSYAFSPYTD